jgi:hypothetical protein
MKKLALFAALVVSTAAWADGNVNMGTKVAASGIDPAVNAKILDADNATGLVGAAFLAQLYAGTTADSLSPVGVSVPFRDLVAAAGYVANSTVSIPSSLIATDGKAWVKMAAWEAAGGTSIEAAQAAGKKYGWSLPIQVTPTSPPAAPANLVGLQGFALIPEPSIMALGLLGAAALLIRRRS